jgi:uncharacterized membrane protein YgcG
MVQMSRRRSLAVVMAVAVIAAGCGTTGDDSGGTIPPVTPAPTLGGVGVVPATPSAAREPVVVVRPPVDADGTEAELTGSVVDGNRILMIGDSILASTSSRYGDHMCEAVVPLGWQVAIEAEPSRFVEFGNRVLDELLRDDADPDEEWNAAVVFLGSNYRGDAVAYEEELVEILDRLAPRPVLLFTVTEYRPDYVEVNEVVNRLGAERDHVTVLDWKTISEAPGILSGDRLHPTDTGRRTLAEAVAVALGPVDGDGECLRSTFRDDSRVGGDSGTVLGRRSSGSGSSGSGSSGSGSSGSGSSATTTDPPPPPTAPTGSGDDGALDPTSPSTPPSDGSESPPVENPEPPPSTTTAP